MQNKIKVAILCGGKSAEHEVSLQSARNIYEAINLDKYIPILIGIDKTGKWRIKEGKLDGFILDYDDPKKIHLDVDNSEEIVMIPQGRGNIYSFVKKEIIEKVEVVFPILHGTFGEDGTVQGLLKLVDIPFVGADVLGSSVGMDKEIMKILLNAENVKIGKYLVLKENRLLSFSEIKEKLNLPFFIKPANLGSSVGVAKVYTEEDFKQSLDNAFLYDRKVLVEEFIKGREIECSVLGLDYPEASCAGEIVVYSDFYSYESKYIDAQGASLKIPAEISKEKQEEVKNIAIKTFEALCCEGLGRVDMFLKENGELVVNEINTMPGFTKNSMYPKLWQESGISYPDLIDKLIQIGITRSLKENKLKTSF